MASPISRRQTPTCFVDHDDAWSGARTWLATGLMLAVAMIGLQLATSVKAKALGIQAVKVSFQNPSTITTTGSWPVAPASPYTQTLHTLPDHLPALLHETRPQASKIAPTSALAQQAREAQILWRHAGQLSDSAPWFLATQQRKQAELTGRGPFLLMLLAFLAMTGVTVALWRQSAALIPQRHHSDRRPRRLR